MNGAEKRAGRHRVSIRRDPARRGTACDAAQKALMRRAVYAVLGETGVTVPSAVDILYTDDEGIRGYNAEYRGLDRPTDVLSFPLLGLSPRTAGRISGKDADPETGKVFLGDIVVSVQRAEAQAAEYGHAPEREMGFLCAHAVLHLLGYDHETDADRAAMRAAEEAVMAELGLFR